MGPILLIQAVTNIEGDMTRKKEERTKRCVGCICIYRHLNTVGRLLNVKIIMNLFAFPEF